MVDQKRDCVSVPVVGGHSGVTIVPLLSQASLTHIYVSLPLAFVCVFLSFTISQKSGNTFRKRHTFPPRQWHCAGAVAHTYSNGFRGVGHNKTRWRSQTVSSPSRGAGHNKILRHSFVAISYQSEAASKLLRTGADLCKTKTKCYIPTLIT